mmetsp:Transcript_8140/g.13123  ORF Transcript_8140/g.13123 Transcript_8140/m.13123 type:complete len:388 (+) Transcript_8140:926-2089(+)
MTLRSSEEFATIAGKIKSDSALAFENGLIEIGYPRHTKAGTSSGLPLWLISYGRRCPSSQAIEAKDPTPKRHVMVCSTLREKPGRMFFLGTNLTDRAGIQAGLGSTLGEAYSALPPLQVTGVHPFYTEEGREALESLPGPFIVMQHRGTGKPQRVHGVKSFLSNKQYISQAQGLVAISTQSFDDNLLWDDKFAFSIRTWMVVFQGRPFLAFGVDGDIVRSTVPKSTLPEKPSTDQLCQAYFPSFLLSDDTYKQDNGQVEIAPLETLKPKLVSLGIIASEEEFQPKFISALRARVASIALASRDSFPAATETGSLSVQHIALDFTLSKDGELRLQNGASDASLLATTEHTRGTLTGQTIHVIERILLGDSEYPELNLLADEENGFVYK